MNNSNNMFYNNNVCQNTGECVRNTTAACIDNGQYFNDVQANAAATCNQQTTYLDAANKMCCVPQPQNGINGQPQQNVFCCPTAPIGNMPCQNERQFACQPPPCCPPQAPVVQCCPSDPPPCTSSDPCQQRQPNACRPQMPNRMEHHAGRLKERHPLDCCDPYANVSHKPIPPAEKWPINTCFGCDDRGCGIKSDECKEAELRRCCTPQTEYMRMHGEMAKQLLCGQWNFPMKIKSEPPCNICEKVMPPCRGYYREYECPMPIDPRTGRQRLKSDQYWKPCQEIEFMDEYRRYMSVPNNGLIKKLRRKKELKKEW